MVQSYYNQPEMVMAQKSLELSAIKKLCHITESVDRTDKADKSILVQQAKLYNIIYGEKVHFQDAEGNKLTKLGRCDSV